MDEQSDDKNSQTSSMLNKNPEDNENNQEINSYPREEDSKDTARNDENSKDENSKEENSLK